jgi:copper chaperone CopZ
MEQNVMKNRLIPVIATLVLGVSTSAVAGDLNRLLSVKGMTCPACSAKVRNALTGVSGVKTAEVDLKSGKAKVIADPLVKSADLVNAVQKAGFQAEVSNPAPSLKPPSGGPAKLKISRMNCE